MGSDTSAWYSSNAAFGAPQARSPSACGQGEVTPAAHFTQLLVVGTGAVATAAANAFIGSRIAPAVTTATFSTSAAFSGARAPPVLMKSRNGLCASYAAVRLGSVRAGFGERPARG